MNVTRSSNGSVATLALDSGQPTTVAGVHGQMIDLIQSNQAKKDRLAELLDWSPDFAFVAFCMENNLVIPPAETPPAEESIP